MPATTGMYRLHDNRFRTNEFNPGPKGAGRFHFFGTPAVPVLYTAATEAAAVAETLLRNIPVAGGVISYGDYQSKVMAALEIKREVRLASFLGTDLRALKVGPEQLTTTPGQNYPQTRKWAEAAHAAGFDGIAWMSRQDNSDRAYMFFGDRVTEGDFEVVPGSGRIFAVGPDLDWLTDFCAPLHIEVLPGSA
ncbi:RES family NAD+ phosphorylase [Sinomonas terrae]|uniref:RES family NAD+ phosphorylase n=1 Tax=Sinomonas terrae TaxID=2908838 RepID=A0ABS9U6B5_9MICC|nr:RES family NAD+ phosphorylase [Sinomonas terrae]MCH6472076.1 RES family NAD+ phosphorylase [Sinomonas terrae]